MRRRADGVKNGSFVHRVAAVQLCPPQPRGPASLAACQTRVFIVLLEGSEAISLSPRWKVSCRALGEVWVGLCHPCPWAACTRPPWPRRSAVVVSVCTFMRPLCRGLGEICAVGSWQQPKEKANGASGCGKCHLLQQGGPGPVAQWGGRPCQPERDLAKQICGQQAP